MPSVRLTSREPPLYRSAAWCSVSYTATSVRESMAQKKTTVEVYLQPGARSSEIVGFRDSVLCVRVTAPPRKGQANQALLALMAEALGVSKSDLAIIRGYASRRKVLAVQGLDSGELKRRLARASAEKE